MTYAISRASRRLRSTTKSTVRLGDRSIPLQKRLEPRSRALGRAVDDEIGPQVLAIFERPNLRAFLDEEIERIVDRHVGDDVDLDLQFVDQFGKDIARQPIAIRVLLDVHEMIGRRNFQRVRYDPRAAMGRGPEPDDLRPERDRPVIAIVRQMMDGGADGHAGAELVTDHRTFHNLLRRTIASPNFVVPPFPRARVCPPRSLRLDVAAAGVPAPGRK